MLFNPRVISFAVMLTLAPEIQATQIDQIQRLYSANQLEQAYALAQSMEGDLAGQPDFDFLYGILALKTEHPQIAVFALERVLAQDPRNAVAHYEHAMALLQVNDLVSAKVAFTNVLSLQASDVVKDNARKLIQVVENAHADRARKSRLSVDSALDIGFNSNSKGGTTGIEEFPYLGVKTLDGFVNLGAAVNYEQASSNLVSFFSSIATNNRKNFQSQTWDYNNVGVRVGLDYKIGRVNLRFPVEFQVLFLDYKFARTLPSIGVDFNVRWNSSNLTTLGVKGAYKFYDDKIDNYFSLPVFMRHESLSLMKDLDVFFELGYARAFTMRDTLGPKVSSSLSVLGEVSYEIAESHFLVPSIRFSLIEYPYPTSLTGTRWDKNLSLQLSYEWRFAKNWSLNPAFLFYYNNSNEDSQSFMQNIVQVGLRYHL